MAPLPRREQRHPFFRYQGLEYSNRDIANFEERLGRIHDRDTHRVHVLNFKGMLELMRDVFYARILMEHRDDDGVMVFTSQAWGRVFETRGPLVRELILEFLAGLDLERCCLVWILLTLSSFSRTLIRDPVLRLCHRMIAHSIAGRSQTPEKVPTRPARQEGNAGGVAEEAPVALGGGEEDEEMPQAVSSPPRTQGERIDRLEEDVHGMREVFDNEVQFGAYWDAQGITHNFLAPRTPQSNGIVERKNRTLQEMSRTMLNEQSIP
ncbi:uncharacterized mitochondrial protein-like protein [Tanacetum coccineum]